MIDHLTLHVNDIDKSKLFYTAILKPLGYGMTSEFPEWKLAGYGTKAKSSLWVYGDGCKQPTHIAFTAKSADAVKVCYKAGIKAGGKDNGKPGIRKNYSAGYYAAFVLDLDGHNIEIVFHDKTKKAPAKKK
ncbi:MAG: hypothetical protein JWO50_560 [Candidatus Kaiserbacteria bacterium]|nr:hypothetical protein [Candidatus Kaiserbacteria bacterium]